MTSIQFWTALKIVILLQIRIIDNCTKSGFMMGSDSRPGSIKEMYSLIAQVIHENLEYVSNAQKREPITTKTFWK